MQYYHSFLLIPVRRVAALLLLLSMGGPLFAQEMLYVSDQATLKMYEDSALSKALPALKAGDRVQVLKRGDGYSEVRLADGTQGWVRSNRLLAAKPAVVEIKEVREELNNLESEYAALLLEAEVVPADDPELIQRAETAEAARDGLQKQVAELETDNVRQLRELTRLRHMQDIRKPRDLLLWTIVPLLALVSGFFIGFKYLEAKLRARFGGHNPI